MFYIGIDIAKRSHVATILDNQGERIGKHFSFTNSQDGFNKLLTKLTKLSQDTSEFVCGMEATGNFWESTYQFLESNNFQVLLLNPFQTNQYKKLMGKKIKTDAVDSLVIAGLIRSGEANGSFVPQENIKELRELVKLRAYLIKDRNSYKRKMMSLMQVLFPEYADVVSTHFGKVSLAILSEYQSANDFATLSPAVLLAKVRKLNGRNFSLVTAENIVSAAKQSVASTMAVGARKFSLKIVIEQIKTLSTSIKQLEKQFESLIDPDGDNYSGIDGTLSTIPGVGPKTIATFISEVGDGSRFKTTKDLIGYIGFYPKISESGNFKNAHPKITKAGPSHLRHALYLAAVACIKHNHELRNLYHKKLSQGKSAIQAIIVVARKLAIIMLSMLKSGEVYQPHLVFTQTN